MGFRKPGGTIIPFAPGRARVQALRDIRYILFIEVYWRERDVDPSPDAGPSAQSEWKSYTGSRDGYGFKSRYAYYGGQWEDE